MRQVKWEFTLFHKMLRTCIEAMRAKSTRNVDPVVLHSPRENIGCIALEDIRMTCKPKTGTLRAALGGVRHDLKNLSFRVG